MTRKKRAWNNSNPLYRYLQKKKGIKTKKTKGGQMARKRRSSSRRGGKNMLMNGVMPQGGSLISKVIMGVGVNILQKKFAPQVIPFQGEALAFVVGGAPASAGAFLANTMLVGQVGTVATQQGIKFY